MSNLPVLFYNRIVQSRPLATIDIGTNTFRLLIAEVTFIPGKNNFRIKEILSERIITRLGEGISKNGLINEQAVARSIAALKKFRDILLQHRVQALSAVATSALRDAGNGDSFIKQARQESGFDILIISGEEEAKKTASGMLLDIQVPETALLVDIGGGSTELVLTEKKKNRLIKSINLGVLHLAGKYMKNDPPDKEHLARMEDEIAQKIRSAHSPFSKLFTKKTVLIGTAGTVTALASMAQNLNVFDHRKIHNTKVSGNLINNIYSRISALTSVERAKPPPFEPARLDIIVPGTFILLKLMEEFGFKEIIVSNYGLREGLLLELYEKNL
jgi:exopolyphosphatase/guanosine-5'-triphosphate,3'-diphosphate pyrophosphatase